MPALPRTHLLNLAIISSAFFCIFFAFGYKLCQPLDIAAGEQPNPSLIPGRLGYWCLASLYGTMCVSSLFLASPLAKALRERKALVLGASTYVIFVAANLYPNWATLIPASAIMGMGAGVLWSYITAAGANYAQAMGKPPKSEMGLFNGIFAAARTRRRTAKATRKRKRSKRAKATNSLEEGRRTRRWCSLDLSSIGFVFAWYCLVMTLCSALLGRLSDTVGRRLFLVVGVVCHVPFYLLFGLLWPSAWVPEDVLSHNPLTVYASVTMLSVGDSCFTTLPPILMSVFFTDNTEPAFANHKFYQSLGSVFGFILGPLITFPVKILLLSTGLCTATALIILLDRRFASLDSGT